MSEIEDKVIENNQNREDIVKEFPMACDSSTDYSERGSIAFLDGTQNITSIGMTENETVRMEIDSSENLDVIEKLDNFLEKPDGSIGVESKDVQFSEKNETIETLQGETQLEKDKMNVISVELVEEEKQELPQSKINIGKNNYSFSVNSDLNDMEIDLASIPVEKMSYEFGKVELITFAQKPFVKGNNYLRGCKWSPDGATILTASEDYCMRLFDLPHSLYDKVSWMDCDNKNLGEIPSTLKIFEGGLIRDFAWNPQMSSNIHSTCWFVCSSSGSPIHMWNSVNGGLKATYLGYDYADEVISALSIGFSAKGDQIYAGYRNEVKLFNVEIPGRKCTSYNIKRISKKLQKGLISCIQENPGLPSVFAIGTYQKKIGLYTKDGQLACIFSGQKGGLTQLSFSEDGSKLYSGARKDGEILCWDLRKPGDVVYSMVRTVETNQRIYFDFLTKGTHIVSGSTDGKVKFWKLPNNSSHQRGSVLQPCVEFRASQDCVNSVSVNPKHPVIATGSGQRPLLELVSDEETDTLFIPLKSWKKECLLKLWWIEPHKKRVQFVNTVPID